MLRLSFVLGLFFVFVSTAIADTPVGPMNYQGRLLDNAGVPVTGSYNFVVRVYDAASAGTLKYQENHNAVAVDDGVYNFLVGTQTKSGGDSTWSVELWNCCANLFMEIVVNGEALSPRHRLAAAPYAFQATLALTTNNALALGGVSASQYQNTLADICVSGKGKWLELVSKCLGVGASFPGPIVNWNTLTASSDFTELDLSRADIRGINFSGADLTGSVFNSTQYSVQGISGSNISDTVWDSATTPDVSVTALLADSLLNGATFSNMDMSKWSFANLMDIHLENLSAVDLTACPAGLGMIFTCADLTFPASGKYILLGIAANFSEDSLMKNRLNSAQINIDLFQGANVAGATFEGNQIEGIFFQNVNMPFTNFARTILRNVTFNAVNMSNGTTFRQSTLKDVVFQDVGMSPIADFSAAELSHVVFKEIGKNSQLDFSEAILDNVTFESVVGGTMSMNFDASHLANPTFLAQISYMGLLDGEVSGGAYFGADVQSVYFQDMVFKGGNVAGRLNSASFSGSTFINVSFSGANFTGATGMGGVNFVDVSWLGATCPNGVTITSTTGSCIGQGI